MLKITNLAGSFAERFAFSLQEKAHREKTDLSVMSHSIQISKANFEYLVSSATFKIDKSEFKAHDLTYECFYNEHNVYYLNYNAKNNIYTLTFYAGFEELTALLAPVDPIKEKTDSYVSWVTGFDNTGKPVIKKIHIDTPQPIYESFYPKLKQSIESTFQAYLESKSSVLILIGPPGTGKTNAIRKLITDSHSDVLLTYDPNVANMDGLFSYFYDSKEKFLVVEDADTYISSRNNGNEVMKKLLNVTDGLTANSEKKIVFSTNLPNIASIDPALLRPGRCFGVLNFEALNLQESKAVATDLGMDPEALSEKQYTLAEIFEIKNSPQGLAMHETKTRSFGFM